MRRWAPAAAAIILTTAFSARGDPADTEAVVIAKHGAGNVGRPKTPPPEPRSVPDVRLAIETPSTRGAWTMRVTNEGEVPVRVVADARLLSFEVTLRGARAPVHCELPADMRPVDDLERALVVPPKRSYTEAFEPRLYCFGTKLDALAPGAVFVARLGWVARTKAEPPFEASPIEGVEPELAPIKMIQSPPLAIPDEPTAWSVPSATRFEPDSDTPVLSLRGPAWVEAEAPNDIEIPVTLRNDGARSAVVRLRPEVLGFDLVGPAGAESCAWPMVPAAAMREMFTTLRPGESETLVVTLDSYCTAHGLDQAGLVVVRPRLDSRKASGGPVGLHSFDGQLMAMTPTVVRLHRGTAPRPLRRPRLEGVLP